MSSPFTRARSKLPPVDESIVAEGSGYEMDDGKLIPVPPADEPHGDRHSKLAAVLEAHAAEDFNVAIDMLTRINQNTNRAPDASVYPRARDPETGGRQLEHLAFEIVSTETLQHAGKRARQLAWRGVRRIFAVDVTCERVLEWSQWRRSWTPLAVTSSIADPALAVALPVGALLDVDRADDAVARALLARRNAVVGAAMADGRSRAHAEGIAEGRAAGIATTILAVLASREISLQPEQRSQILEERDLERLQQWSVRAVSCASAAELLASS